MNTKSVAVASILAALYVAVGLVVPFISFGLIQCRVSDALYPLITLLGAPGVVGLFLGQLVYNVYGYSAGLALGALDLLSPLVFLPFKYLIMRLGYKAVLLHVAAVSLWVGYLLYNAFGVPPLTSVPLLFAGEFIAEVIIGIPLAEAVKRRLGK